MSVHPVIARSGLSALSTAIPASCPEDDLAGSLRACADLRKGFAEVGDGRQDRGREHPVAAVLALAAGAVVAGMRSFTAIAGWVVDVPAELLARLYDRPTEAAAPPSKSTIWRVLTGVDAARVDAVVGAWLAEQAAADDGAEAGPRAAPVAIAVDGKTVRGAIDVDGAQTHLLAAVTHGDGLVLGQVEVGAKSNEVPMFAPLLDALAETGVDLAGAVLTADALHTVRAHAEALHTRGVDFCLPVKENTPRLFAALDALPWRQTPIAAREVDRGHGRITTRTIQVRPAPPALPFPHVEQVWLVERYVTDSAGQPLSAVAVLGVTSLSADHADPLLVAGLIRRHWGVESLHWLRDTVWREDDSTAHTGSGPRVMAALRNLAIGALHLTGRRDITEATRWAGRSMDRPFKILKLA